MKIDKNAAWYREDAVVKLEHVEEDGRVVLDYPKKNSTYGFTLHPHHAWVYQLSNELWYGVFFSPSPRFGPFDSETEAKVFMARELLKKVKDG